MRPGQVVRRGRIIRVTDSKAESEKKTIAQYARLAWNGEPTCAPVLLQLRAIFAIPKGWKKELLAQALECKVPHIADPDLDQLVKQAQDAMTGIVYWDDNQVCGYAGSVKRYGTPERTEITITVLDQDEAAKTPGQRDLEKAAASGQLIPGQLRPTSKSRNRSKTRSGW